MCYGQKTDRSKKNCGVKIVVTVRAAERVLARMLDSVRLLGYDSQRLKIMNGSICKRFSAIQPQAISRVRN